MNKMKKKAGYKAGGKTPTKAIKALAKSGAKGKNAASNMGFDVSMMKAGGKMMKKGMAMMEKAMMRYGGKKKMKKK